MRKAPIVGTAAIVVALAGTLIAASPAIPQARSTYTFYVAAESDDIVEKIAFGPGGLRLIKSIEVGSWPTEIEGPHGLGISPDGEYWYLSLAHVQPGPHGSVVKYATEDDAWLGEVAVGMFPATLAVSPSIGLLYVANFNLHGLPEPSSISVVDPDSMTEVGQVDVGVMRRAAPPPHPDRRTPPLTTLGSAKSRSACSRQRWRSRRVSACCTSPTSTSTAYRSRARSR